VFELDRDGRIVATLYAASAVPVENGWELHQVIKSTLGPAAQTETHQRMLYDGNLSLELLQVLTIKPRKMSIRDLHAYLGFLDENRLESKTERMIFWKKISSPATVFIMCLLAVPFVLGSQRQSGSGQRLLIGILLGLGYVVSDRLLTQLGGHLEINPLVVALLPNLLFLLLAVYLLMRKQSLTFRIRLLTARG